MLSSSTDLVLLFLSLIPSVQAQKAQARVTVIVLQERSANAPSVVKLLVEASNPKSTEHKNRRLKMNPFASPAVKVLAPDQFITIVTNRPIAKAETIVA